MMSAICALVISLMMIVLVIFKGSVCEESCYICKKSEIEGYLDIIPDDCIIEIRIGRNSYDEFPRGNSPRRSLRNHISE